MEAAIFVLCYIVLILLYAVVYLAGSRSVCREMRDYYKGEMDKWRKKYFNSYNNYFKIKPEE